MAMAGQERYIPYESISDFRQYPPEEMPNGMFVNMYYQDSVARHIAHRLKSGDPDALDTAAEFLACQIDRDCRLVPAPNSCGRAAYTLRLCELIRRKAAHDVEILDVLSSGPRRPLYDIKAPIYAAARADGATPDFSGLSLEFDVADYDSSDRPVYFVDNVFDRGITFDAARRKIPGLVPLCFAVTAQGANRYARMCTAAPAKPQMESVSDITDMARIAEIVDTVYSAKTRSELADFLFFWSNRPVDRLIGLLADAEAAKSVYCMSVDVITWADGSSRTIYHMSRYDRADAIRNPDVKCVTTVFLSLSAVLGSANGCTTYGKGKQCSIFIDVLGPVNRNSLANFAGLPPEEQQQFLGTAVDTAFAERKRTLAHEVAHAINSTRVDGNNGRLAKVGGSKRRFLDGIVPKSTKRFLHDSNGYTATYSWDTGMKRFDSMPMDDETRDRMHSQLRFTSSDEINSMIKSAIFMALCRLRDDESISAHDDLGHIIYDDVMRSEGHYILHDRYPKDLSMKLRRRIYSAAMAIGGYMRQNMDDFRKMPMPMAMHRMADHLAGH